MTKKAAAKPKQTEYTHKGEVRAEHDYSVTLFSKDHQITIEAPSTGGLFFMMPGHSLSVPESEKQTFRQALAATGEAIGTPMTMQTEIPQGGDRSVEIVLVRNEPHLRLMAYGITHHISQEFAKSMVAWIDRLTGDHSGLHALQTVELREAKAAHAANQKRAAAG